MASKYGPYTPVRSAGDFHFVSGQIGVDPATKQAAADIAAQTRQALVNLGAVLREKGLTEADVVKTTVFLKDLGDFAAVNEVYQKFFPEPRPARSCVGVAGLPRIAATDLLVEIEAVAYAVSAEQPA